MIRHIVYMPRSAAKTLTQKIRNVQIQVGVSEVLILINDA